jgi:transcriptional regulator with XRE-family HTH domain
VSSETSPLFHHHHNDKVCESIKYSEVRKEVFMESPLVKWRKALGFTQQELALISEISSSKISEIEHGFLPLGEDMENFLKEVGEEAITVIDQHEAFREYKKKELRKKIHAGD